MEAKIADQDRYIEELASKRKCRKGKLERMKHECDELDREIEAEEISEVSHPFVQC